MASVNEANGSLLDASLMMWTNNFSNGSQHMPGAIQLPPNAQFPMGQRAGTMPYVFAGRCGGTIKTGRYLDYSEARKSRPTKVGNEGKGSFVGETHQNLLLSVVKAFGLADATFGDATYCSGGLPGFVT